MSHWLLGKRRGLLAYLLIAVLVAGGLGWATFAALRLEREQREERAQRDRDSQIRVAMEQLENRLAKALAHEDSRPYNHYSAISAPALLLSRDGQPMTPGAVLEPSPLLNAELPEWMLLHFQADDLAGWASPQVLSATLRDHLSSPNIGVPLDNVTPARKELLVRLARQARSAGDLAAAARQKSEALAVKDTALVLNEGQEAGGRGNAGDQQQSPPNGQASQQAANSSYGSRLDQRNRVQKETNNPSQADDLEAASNNLCRNGENWLRAAPTRRGGKGIQAMLNVGSLTPLWLTDDGNDLLLLVRIVRVNSREICQGIVLDWQRLQSLLAYELRDLFPDAQLLPIREEFPVNPELAMVALPFQLDPGPAADGAGESGWTPLRVGLTLAWVAALAALVAVGLGGRSLVDLSQRRIRFVSAVTHELRTPLTTLRLYLDMLTGGMVTDEGKKAEYLHTLNAETDRLNRLVANVLDFSRLENQRPQLHLSEVRVTALLESVSATWQGRCQDAGKDLVLENAVDAGTVIETDVELVQQIIANLIDNACKYSRDADDNRILLRTQQDGQQLSVFVEDRGPGVARRDRRSLFHPFRRGEHADVTAGGVGLGLALAGRWATLLGGVLTLEDARKAGGATFRLQLPLSARH
jgi:signal transduction histidine kinase